MKIKIKLSNTQKFCVEVKDKRYQSLISEVNEFIQKAYDIYLNPLVLSLNGVDPIQANFGSDISLCDLGIVSGDLITIIQNSLKNTASKPDSKVTVKNTIVETKMSESIESFCNKKICSLLESIDKHPPPSVKCFFDQYCPESASEAFNILVHIIMTESNFVLGESPASPRNMLPLSWKESIATLKYYYSGLENFAATIVIVTMGSIKQILATYTGQESEISVKLNTKDYIPAGELTPENLVKLSYLSKKLRNEFLYPLQVSAHLCLGFPAPWHFSGIPQEILLKIAELLPLKTLVNLSKTCKRLNSSLADNKLWFSLFKRDFPKIFHESDTVSGSDWKSKYQAAYKTEKERKQLEADLRYVFEDPNPRIPNPYYPMHPINPDDPFGSTIPRPRGPSPYPPQPDPIPGPNPYWDPDSPYFGGEIPHLPGPYPLHPLRPRNPRPNPLDPTQPFMPSRPGGRSGPRIHFL